MDRLDTLLQEVTPKHSIDYGFIIAGLISLILAVTQNQSLLYVVAAGGLFLGVLMYLSVSKRITQFKYIKNNRYADYQSCINAIERIIERQKKSIAIDQRKADAGGKDSYDSAQDVIRKTKVLEKYLEIQELLTPDVVE
jgi:hypothetical protein